MESLTIFISSPGDVAKERETAARVIATLQNEFSTRCRIQPYFWEYEPMQATKDFQDNIPSTALFDVVVCILWSRLGSRLHSKHRKPDGGLYESGTEYELETARIANEQFSKPTLLVFLNRTEPKFPARPRELREDLIQQFDKLENFVAQWFRDPKEGTWRFAVNEYKGLAEFEQRLEHHLRELVSKHALPGPTRRPTELVWKEGSPFRGLNVFEVEHSPVFFGRTRAIDDLITALRNQALNGSPFVLIFGLSGVGKSSLARAGVLPLLTKPGVIEGIGLWRRAVMRPSDVPGRIFDGLATALLRDTALPELARDKTTAAEIANTLEKNPQAGALLIRQALADAADQFRIAEAERLKQLGRELEAENRSDDVAAIQRRLAELAPPNARLALLIDQMEELFTVDAPHQKPEAFVRSIQEIVRSNRVFVVVTMRSDFYPNFQRFPELVELAKGEGQYALIKPNAQEIGQMIRQPANAAGLIFETDAKTKESLDELIRDEATREPAILPLMEFMLDQLYTRRTPEGMLTYSAYRELGGVEGALAKRANEEFGKLDAGAQRAFDKVMRALVTTTHDEGASFTRRWAKRDEVASAADARKFIDAFIDARLFLADQNQVGEPVVSVSHEALLTRWPRLATWLTENREFLRIRWRIAGAATEWAQAGQDDSFLLQPGKQLAEGEVILTEHREDLTVDEVSFIEASAAAARRRIEAERRRSRRVLIIVSGALAAALLFLVYGFFQYREAKHSSLAANRARADAEGLIGFMLNELYMKLRPIGRLSVLREVVEMARFYQEHLPREAGTATSLKNQAMALNKMGDILMNTGRLGEAAAAYESGLRVIDEIERKQSVSTESQTDRSLLLLNLAYVQRVQGKVGEALENFREALSLRQMLTLHDATEQRQRDLAQAFSDLGEALMERGNLTEAAAKFQKSLKIRERIADSHPQDAESRHELAMTDGYMSDLLRAQRRFDEALHAAETSLSIRRALLDEQPNNSEWQRLLAVALNRVGNVYFDQQQFDLALGAYRQALEHNLRLAQQDPSNANWQRGLSLSHVNIGEVLLKKGHPDDALVEQQQAITIREGLVKQDRFNDEWLRDLALAYSKAAKILSAQQSSDAAFRLAGEGSTILKTLLAKDPSSPRRLSDVAVAHGLKGDIDFASGRVKEALNSYHEQLTLTEALVRRDPNSSEWRSALELTQQKIDQAQTAAEQDNGHTSDQ